jgi:hypothetical protein
MAQVNVTIAIGADGVVRYYVGNTEIIKAQATAYQNAGAQVIKASQEEGQSKKSVDGGADNNISGSIGI